MKKLSLRLSLLVLGVSLVIMLSLSSVFPVNHDVPYTLFEKSVDIKDMTLVFAPISMADLCCVVFVVFLRDQFMVIRYFL